MCASLTSPLIPFARWVRTVPDIVGSSASSVARSRATVCPAVCSISARIARELDALVRLYGKPASIVSDKGTEFTSRAILKSANENGVDWHYIHTAKPQQNAFIVSFDGSLRDKLLNEEIRQAEEDGQRVNFYGKSGDQVGEFHGSLLLSFPELIGRVAEWVGF